MGEISKTKLYGVYLEDHAKTQLLLDTHLSRKKQVVCVHSTILAPKIARLYKFCYLVPKIIYNRLVIAKYQSEANAFLNLLASTLPHVTIFDSRLHRSTFTLNEPLGIIFVRSKQCLHVISTRTNITQIHRACYLNRILL